LILLDVQVVFREPSLDPLISSLGDST
jgi:hypothetical protein